MNQQPSNRHEAGTSGHNLGLRHTELADQHWGRARSKALADAEGVEFSDRHWEVIMFMRKYYLHHGMPISAQTTTRALNKHFANKGGSSYLRRLFSDGPVVQGSRLANLPTPTFATDDSGTNY